MALEIWSLRRPTDKARHPVHDRVDGRVVYLPEYLKDDPRRVLRGWLEGAPPARLCRRARAFLADLRRDPTANRVRRWGQALVLAAELPPVDRAAVRAFPAYAGLGDALCRHHARPAVERVGACQGHLDQRAVGGRARSSRDCAWLVTCTAHRPAAPARSWRRSRSALQLVYHGLDFAHLPAPPRGAAAARRQRSRPIPSSSCRSAARSRRRAMTISWRRWRCCRAACTGASSMSAPASWPTR